MSSEQGRGSAPSMSAAVRMLGPKPAVMTVAVLAVVAVVALMAQLVSSSQQASRQAAEERFANGAVVRGQLTAALLSTWSNSLRSSAPKLAPTAKALDAFAKASHLGYAALLSRDGSVLAISSGAPPAAVKRLAGRPAYVRQALSGRSWISDVHPAAKAGASTIDLAVPFRSPAGERRILVEGQPLTALAPFLRSFLSNGTAGRLIYVVDSRRHLIAASTSAGPANKAALPPALAQADKLSAGTIGANFVASGGIGSTGWRIVLSQPTATLYPGIAGSRSWLLWAVVALVAAVGIASLLPLRRSHVRAAQLAVAHAEVTALNETLEGRVAERTELAERRAQALSRSNAELEQFASVAAHDLQEPLRKIRMYCERLDRRREDVPEEMQTDVTRMEAAAGRMQNLISDLLDLARVNSRGRELAPVDLALVAAEVVGDLEAPIAEVGAHVEIGALPLVLGDPVQLHQVMQNLISNAVKFHREDVPLHIRVRTESTAQGRCVVLVEDNGIGFDDKYADRIFGTFQRLHGRAEYDGTGIGLSIARKIAWRHDGDITASGVVGEGATFRLTLPVAREGAVAVPRDHDAPQLRENERSAA